MLHVSTKAKTTDDATKLWLTTGWIYLVRCQTCNWSTNVFSSAGHLDELTPQQLGLALGNPHACAEDRTAVTDMTQVFDEHLTATLPQTMIDQLENLPHLRRLGSNNHQRLQAIMDLMRHPNNMLQLWVWTRLSWAFGGCDTEKAAANFSALMATFEQKQESEKSTDPAVKGQALIDLLLAVHQLWEADRKFPQWREYNAFMRGTSEDTWDNSKPSEGDSDA